jgi:hypothetical protein
MMNTSVDVNVMLSVDDTCLKFVNTCVYSASD